MNSYLNGQNGGDVAASIKVLVLTVPCYKESRVIGSGHIEGTRHSPAHFSL